MIKENSDLYYNSKNLCTIMPLVEMRQVIIYNNSMTISNWESSENFSISTNTTADNKLINASSRCIYQPQNPWCGLFGPQQYVEVAYLTVLTVLGVLGNIMLIFSVLFEKKLHKNANIFIVNLAFADFLVSCFSFVSTFYMLIQ